MRIAKVTLENGHTWKTRINGTPEEISNYFYGKLWDCEPFPSEKRSRCIRVEVSPPVVKAQRLNEKDSWDRPLAKDKDGNIYCDIGLGIERFGESWHTMTAEGEPDLPIILID